MKVVLSFILLFIITACKNQPKKEKFFLPIPHERTEYNVSEDDLNLTYIKNTDTLNYTIDGTYKLKKGVSINQGAVKKITHGYMVIDMLSDNDFGYYYSYQLESFAPNNDFGIFNYDDDEHIFYKKIVEDLNSTKTEIRENVNVIKTKDGVRLESKTNNGKIIILWKKVSKDTNYSDVLKDSIIDANKSYVQVYKNRFDQLEEKGFFDFLGF